MMNSKVSINDITIRTDLRSGDIGYVTYLHAILYKQEYGYGIEFESYVAAGLCEFYKSYTPERNRIWVCEHNGQMIGFLLLMDRGEAAQLRYFIIRPKYRGMGLGKKLMRVEHLMHKGEEVPLIRLSTPMKDAILEMTRKKLGCTAVIDDQDCLIGIITDGDLRRFLEKENDPLSKKVGDCMTKSPITISKKELATVALNIMEAKKITSIPVVNKEDKLEGIIQIHDLWQIQMF